MEIHFCDLCNESVPQSDLDKGQAVLLHGRVICATCERAMSGHPSAELGAGWGAEVAPAGPGLAFGGGQHAAQHPGGAASGAPRPAAHHRQSPTMALFGLTIVFLFLLAALSAVFFVRLEGVRSAAEREGSALRQALGENARLFDARIDHSVNGVSVELENARGEVDEVRIRLDEAARHQRDALEALRDELARVGDKTAGIERVEAALELQERQQAQLVDTLAELHAEVLRLGESTRRAATASEPAAPAEPTAAAAPEPERPAWWPLVAELASPSSGKRWQAVQELANSRDPAVAQHLAPMLADEDIFVRMAAARVLGDLKAIEAVPSLIDALEDPEASVREAALLALRSITGQDLEFDPLAKEAERAKRVKAWRDWWKRSAPDAGATDGTGAAKG